MTRSLPSATGRAMPSVSSFANAVWPDESSIRNCIAWNHSAAAQAQRDARNDYVVVPVTATKRIWADGKALSVRLSTAEYREVRRKDAVRHEANCNALYAQVSA